MGKCVWCGTKIVGLVYAVENRVLQTGRRSVDWEDETSKLHCALNSAFLEGVCKHYTNIVWDTSCVLCRYVQLLLRIRICLGQIWSDKRQQIPSDC